MKADGRVVGEASPVHAFLYGTFRFHANKRDSTTLVHRPSDCQAGVRILPQALGRTPGPRSRGADCGAPETHPPAQLPVRISLTRWKPGTAHSGPLQGRRKARCLDPAKFDLKTFRSTYATRMLRQGFDVRTVQHWMGHKSLETTMRYLVPATDVRGKLDQVTIPKPPQKSDTARKSSGREERSSRRGRPAQATSDAPGQVAQPGI